MRTRLKTLAMFALMLPFMVTYQRSATLPDPVSALEQAVTEASDNIAENLNPALRSGRSRP